MTRLRSTTWLGDRRRRRALTAALVAALVAVGTAAAVTGRATVAPSNNSLPTISGTAATGGTLTANAGTWSGSAPITFQYQWRICDGNGAACHDIAGATSQAYVLKRDDAGNTVPVRVTARGGNGGTTSVTSAPSAKIAVAGASNPGCPTPAAGAQSVPIANVAAPARLQIAQFQVTTGLLRPSTRTFSARFQVTDSCGHPVSGALVFPAAVPYNQFSAREASTDTAGWVTMTFDRRAGYPASPKQRQLTVFVRARKAGEPVLGGVSARRLIAFPIGR
jgi:hypothetical protein